MALDKKTEYGGIDISIEAIASVAGDAASECYGVVGLSPRNSFKDELDELLGRENYHKGISVAKTKNGVAVNVYVFCAYDVKITEVISEIQKKVKYVLEKTFNYKFRTVNVYVQGITIE